MLFSVFSFMLIFFSVENGGQETRGRAWRRQQVAGIGHTFFFQGFKFEASKSINVRVSIISVPLSKSRSFLARSRRRALRTDQESENEKRMADLNGKKCLDSKPGLQIFTDRS